MSDGAKSGLAQLVTDVQEAAVEPVKDELGQAIEAAKAAVVNPQALDPAVIQKKQMEAQQRRQNALRVIEWNRQLQADQQKVRQEAQQKDQQEKQGEEQKKQEEKKVKQYKAVERKQQLTATERKARGREIKGGVGG